MAKQNNNNAVTAKVAALKNTFEAAEIDLNAITETATLEEKEAAKTAFEQAELDFNIIPETATAEEKEAAKTAFEAATVEFERIAALPTPEEKQLAQTAYDEAKAVYEKASETPGIPKAKEKLVKGKFLVSPTGKYNLAYNVGEEASLPELQAVELEEAGYFKIAK